MDCLELWYQPLCTPQQGRFKGLWGPEQNVTCGGPNIELGALLRVFRLQCLYSLLYIAHIEFKGILTKLSLLCANINRRSTVCVASSDHTFIPLYLLYAL